jgi:hypothetical protein
MANTVPGIRIHKNIKTVYAMHHGDVSINSGSRFPCSGRQGILKENDEIQAKFELSGRRHHVTIVPFFLAPIFGTEPQVALPE